jgi:O-antigen/teichoic acid export membrane protein
MKSFNSYTKRLLLWSEKYTKTDMIYLAKGGFWLSVQQIVGMGVGLVLSLGMANLVPKESFGVYKYALSIDGILVALTLTGLGTALIPSVVRGFDGALWQAFVVYIKKSFLVFIVGLLGFIYYFINNNTTLSVAFLLIGSLSPIMRGGSLYGAFLQAKKDFQRKSFYGIIATTVVGATMLGTVFLTSNPAIMVAVYFASNTLINLSLFMRTNHIYNPDTRKKDPGLVKYGLHLSLMEIIGYVASNIDKVIIFHYLGATQLAIYSFSMAPVEQLQSGKKMLSTLASPKVSARPFEELKKSTPSRAILLAVLGLGLAGVYSVFAPIFYKLLYPQYLESVIYSQIYSLTLVAVSGTLFQEALLAHKKTKELYYHRTIIYIIQIVLFLSVLPRFGLMGLIISHVFVRNFNILLAYYFVKHPFADRTSSVVQ